MEISQSIKLCVGFSWVSQKEERIVEYAENTIWDSLWLSSREVWNMNGPALCREGYYALAQRVFGREH